MAGGRDATDASMITGTDEQDSLAVAAPAHARGDGGSARIARERGMPPGRAVAMREPLPGRGPRIGLYGNFGIGNFGNEGSLEAMLRFLQRRWPGAAPSCICTAPARAGEDHGVPAVAIGRPSGESAAFRALDRLLLKAPRRLAAWRHALAVTRRLDALVIPGTGILDDFGTGPWDQPYALLRWCLAARLNGTRIAFVSVGAGPILHPTSRLLMTRALRLAHYRSYRDVASRDFLIGLGVPAARDPVFPDLAFALPAPQDHAPRRAGDDRLTVGIGVMAYTGWQAAGGDGIYRTYVARMRHAVGAVLERGHRVRLIIGDVADERAAADVLAGLPRAPAGQDVLVAEPARSLHDVMRQMAETDVVVASRFHNVVCALRLGRPTLSIGYAPKNDALLAEMGLAAFRQHIEGLDVALLLAQLDRLIAAREEHGRRIAGVVDGYRDALSRQEDLLGDSILAAAA